MQAVPADLREPDSFCAAASPSLMPSQVTSLRELLSFPTCFGMFAVSSTASMITEPSMLTSLHA